MVLNFDTQARPPDTTTEVRECGLRYKSKISGDTRGTRINATGAPVRGCFYCNRPLIPAEMRRFKIAGQPQVAHTTCKKPATNKADS